MTEFYWETEEEHFARSTRPCSKHGTINRKCVWSTGGSIYVCPYCEADLDAREILLAALVRCDSYSGANILHNTINHLNIGRFKVII